MQESIGVDKLSFTKSHPQKDFVKKSIANSDFPFHDKEYFKNLGELILNEIIANVILSWFKSLEENHKMSPKLKIVNFTSSDFIVLSDVVEKIFEHVYEIFVDVVNVDLLGYNVRKLTHKSSVNL